MRLLVDTNVVLRAAQESHPQSAASKAALEALLVEGHEVCVVPQVLHEVWAVATRPAELNGLGLAIPQASALIGKIRATFQLLEDPPGLTDRWQSVVSSYEAKGKSSHDARLVAAMQAHGIDRVLTFNTEDFKRYVGLTAITPTDVVKDQEDRLRADDLARQANLGRTEPTSVRDRDKDRDR